MSPRRCPICQTVAAPLIDADGRQFCTSCDLQLPPEDFTPTPSPVPTARPARGDGEVERPRRATKTVTARREPEPDAGSDDRPRKPASQGGKVILVAVLLVGAFFLLALFFGFVIWVKTLPVSTPTTKPKTWSTGYGGRNLDPWDVSYPTKADTWGPVPTRKW